MRHQEFPTELKQLMISVPIVEEKHLLLNASFLHIKKHLLSLHRRKALILCICSMLLQSPVDGTLCLDFDSSQVALKIQGSLMSQQNIPTSKVLLSSRFYGQRN